MTSASSLVFCSFDTILFSSNDAGDILMIGEETSWYSWTILWFTLSGLKGTWLLSFEWTSGNTHTPTAEKNKKLKLIQY